MNCPKCGAFNQDGSVNCSICNNVLIGSNNIEPIVNIQLQVQQAEQNPNIELHDETLTTSTEIKSQNIINQNGKGKKKKTLIVLISSILLLLAIIFLVFSFGKKNLISTEYDIYHTNSFFLQDKNSKYALFNSSGKKLTDFIYTDASEFINNSSIVKINDKYGLINSNGETTIKIGKYNYLYSNAGLYKAVDKKYRDYLVDRNGKILYDLKEVEITTFSGVDTYMLVKTKSETLLLNYEGEKLLTIKNIIDEEEPKISGEENIILVFYNNKNYVLNFVNNEKISTFNSNKQYCISKISDDKKIILLRSCNSNLENEEEIEYKVIINSKIKNINSKCKYVYISNNKLICSEGYGKNEYLLDSNLKIGSMISEAAYISNGNYTKMENGSYKGVSFYKNNKLLKKVYCKKMESVGEVHGLYILNTNFYSKYSMPCNYEFGIYEFYDINGNRVFNKYFKQVTNFDDKNLARVSDDGINYYLINMKGKKVSSNYSEIDMSDKEYYTVINAKGLRGILDGNGEEIIKCKYSDVEIKELGDNDFAVLTTSDLKYIVYNLKSKKEILITLESPELQDNYIEVEKENKTQYYTYNGKLFFER